MTVAAGAVDDGKLIRAVGVRGLTAAIINLVIGAGIFVLPAQAAAGIGAAAPLAYLVCAAGIALVMLCFAESGSRVAASGGPYEYVGMALGPLAGFLCGFILYISFVLASGGIAVAFLDVVGAWVPALHNWWVHGAALVAIFAALAWVNIRGVKLGAGVVEAMTLAKLLPLAVFVLVGLFFVHPANLRIDALPSVGSFGRTSLIMIFTFTGAETALTASGEVRDPARTVPRALLLGVGAIAIIYIGVQVVAQGVLGPSLAASQAAPIADAAGRFLGPVGGLLVALGAAISMAGYVSGDMLASPRMCYVFGRDRFLPGLLAGINERFRTPHWAIVIHGVLCIAVALSGTFLKLAILSNLSTMFVYLLAAGATLVLRARDVRTAGTPFVIPGGPMVPVLAIGVILWLTAHSTWQEFAAIGGAVVAGILIYGWRAIRDRAVAPAPQP